MADVLLTYAASAQGCDISFAAGDLAWDVTPASALLFSLLADGRALPGDVLPFTPPPTAANAPLPLGPWRRGWPGDALDAAGQRVGSRLWLLERAKAGQATLDRARAIIADAIAWLQTARGLPLSVSLAWQTPTMLGYRVTAGTTSLSASLRAA